MFARNLGVHKEIHDIGAVEGQVFQVVAKGNQRAKGTFCF